MSLPGRKLQRYGPEQCATFFESTPGNKEKANEIDKGMLQAKLTRSKYKPSESDKSFYPKYKSACIEPTHEYMRFYPWWHQLELRNAEDAYIEALEEYRRNKTPISNHICANFKKQRDKFFKNFNYVSI